MTSPAPIIELPVELRRTAAATAFAAASLLGSLWILVQGLELLADDICFGPCPPATHGSQGGSLVLVGLAALVASLIAAAFAQRPQLSIVIAVAVLVAASAVTLPSAQTNPHEGGNQ